MRIRTIAAAALLAAWALGGAAPASAVTTGGACDGTVDPTCRYCSSSGGNAGYPPECCSTTRSGTAGRAAPSGS